jgi:hypothetical protein
MKRAMRPAARRGACTSEGAELLEVLVAQMDDRRVRNATNCDVSNAGSRRSQRGRSTRVTPV